jgi:hypothetical protein
MTKAHFVKKARKDYPEAGIKKGEPYYWWKFNFRNHIFKSKTAPRRSQLTTSDFLGRIWDIEDSIGELTVNDDFESEIETFKSELEELGQEQDDKLSNMPDQLQEAPTGQILSGRVESAEQMSNDLDAIDLEVDEQAIRNEVTGKLLSDKGKTLDQLDDSDKTELEEKFKEAVKERKEEILEEIQNVSYGGE